MEAPAPFTLDRPRRSLLYVPASNLRALEKARGLTCDGVILDLEDGVAPGAKGAARDAAVAAVMDGGFGHREVIVRVNALDTEWGRADLNAVTGCGADAVLVPKIHTSSDIYTYEALLRDAPPNLRLWAMIETALAALKVEEIASTASATRLAAFVLGTNDLAKELRIKLDARRAPIAALLCLAVTAARAHGVVIIDGVYNAFDDEAGFEAQCQEGVDYGFEGKTLIHPRQIERCNKMFAPSAAEIAWARRIKAAFDEPDNAHKGAISLDGNMVERLHLAQAQRTLDIASAIARHA
jgi:citrate lyase subunit beta / citryl-CoA lyase